jgi:class 3 adenylate cyclase/TolB-like protein/Tfp pilus assembly protein PilF
MIQDAKRRLTAIMFTDIVGYSALSHRRESLALELLDEHRKVLRPIFTRFHGREIKTIGDAFLTEFDSAFEAVRCAIEIQRTLRERNAGETHERRIALRIGLHLGDVVSTEGDVYGDGVNVAARLLHVAHAGGIALSDSVYQQVHNKIAEPFEKTAARKLKNIAHPIEIYRVGLDPRGPARPLGILRSRLRRAFRSTRSSRGLAAGLALGLAFALAAQFRHGRGESDALDLARVAVIPLRDQSASGEDGEFLADGLTEEIISSLSRVSGIRVLARSTMMQFKSKNKTAGEIGRELKAGLLLEGTLTRDHDHIRVNVQLTDANTQEALWSERFDGKLRDIYGIHRRISERVAGEVIGTRPNSAVAGAMPQAARGRSPASLAPPAALPGARTAVGLSPEPLPSSALDQEAYLLYLKGRFLINKRTEADLRQGIAQLKQSVAAEPRNASAHAAIANALSLLSYYGYLSPMQAVSEGQKFIDRALELDPSSAEAWLARAEKEAYFDYDWASAERSYRRALASQPGHSTAHQWFGEYLIANGRFEEARSEMSAALDLDPLSLLTNTGAVIPEYYAGNFAQAVKRFGRVTEMDPSFVVAHIWLGRSYAQLGDTEAAIRELSRALELSRGSELIRAHLGYAFGLSGQPDKARAILRGFDEQGKKEYVSCYAYASVHAGLGEREPVLKYLQKCFDEHSDYLVHLKIDPVFKAYRRDPAFAALVAKLHMN